MRTGPRRAVAIVAAVLSMLVLPAAAAAAPEVDFGLSVPDPCVAGSCRVALDYDTSGLRDSGLVEVDWRHAGTAETAFASAASLTCLAFESCVLRSPPYDAPGTYGVALRVTDLLDRSVAHGLRTITVVAARGAVPAPGAPQSPAALCGPAKSGEQCGPGNGRRTKGGGALVSHAGWPAVTGILWKVLDSGAHAKTGGPANDELLGHHGSDRIDGGGGNDILWGDWDPADNNTRQRDTLAGGAGNDWIYPSHGRTVVRAGSGADHVKAYYGGGTIDCGPGRDTAQVRTNGAYRLRNCERVVHFCQYGSTPDGACRQPGARARAATRRD